MSQPTPLKILFLAAEVVPFVKTGGLADVAGSLPQALRRLGHDVRVTTPRYGRVDRRRFAIEPLLGEYPVPMDSAAEPAELRHTASGGVPVYMVESPRYFEREGIYGYADDAERFIFYCRAALEGARRLKWQPHVIHCHDWHTALVPTWLKTSYAGDPFFQDTATLYTIHSLGFHGVFGHRVLEIAGIDAYDFELHADAARLSEAVNFMERGIYHADVINTVSETHAREILTPEFGEGMATLLAARKDRVFGVLNGIDVERYNPETDPYLAGTYSIDTLERRADNKRALQREAGLAEDPDAPLLGVISRLVPQKGIDLLSEVIEPVFHNLGAQLVLLGTGEAVFHERFGELVRRYPRQAGVFLTFNANLASLIYGGSDMFLMPSRVEPCGLGQMIAMRYGSVPVVRATGGLADTVQDYNPADGSGHGFSFGPAEPLAFYTAAVRAVEAYRNRETWRTLQRRAMQLDFSWERSARRYVELYRTAMRISREAVQPHSNQR